MLAKLQEIKSAEEQAARLEMRADGARAERRRLEAAVEEVQLSCAAGQADLAALRRDLGTLEAKVPPSLALVIFLQAALHNRQIVHPL